MLRLKNLKPRVARGETPVVRCGFRGKNQLPLFMVWREYRYNCYRDDNVAYAEVILNVESVADVLTSAVILAAIYWFGRGLIIAWQHGLLTR